MKIRIFISVALLLLTAAAAAQEAACDRQKSFTDCLEQLFAENITDKTEASLAAKATSSIQPDTGRGLLDLLPTFASAFGIDGLKEQDGKLTFDRRFEMGQWRVSANGTAYLGAELFAPLEEMLPEAIREARSQELDKEIGDFDKVDYRLTVSRETASGDIRFGRDPDDYAEGLVNSWIAESVRDQQIAFTQALSSFSERIPPAGDLDPLRMLNVPIAQLPLPASEVAALEAKLTQSAGGLVDAVHQLDDTTDRIDELINNQPQVLFDVVYEDRKPLTGADRVAASFTYEMGLAGNINKYLRWARRNASGDCQGDPSRLTCLKSFFTAYPEAGDAGQRVAFSLSYADTRPLHFELPADQFIFDQPGAEKVIGSLTYGRYFPKFQFFNQVLPEGMRAAGSPNQGTRVDLEARYENLVEDAGMLKDRLVATLTFTQGMTINTGMSFGIVYANRPEFLGDVDDKLSANIGLRWKTGLPGQ